MAEPNCTAQPTAAQQRAAVTLVNQTVAAAQKYTSLAAAKAAGYVPVTPTGKRIVHYINPSIYRSGQALNPEAIPALVYVNTGSWRRALRRHVPRPEGTDAPAARWMSDPVAHPHRPLLQQGGTAVVGNRRQLLVRGGERQRSDPANDARLDDARHGRAAGPGSSPAQRGGGRAENAGPQSGRTAGPEPEKRPARAFTTLWAPRTCVEKDALDRSTDGIVEGWERTVTTTSWAFRPPVPPDLIRSHYRSLIQKVHPDLGGPIALFRQVQESYEVLSDPVRRASYDRTLEALHRRGSGDLRDRRAPDTAVRHAPPRRPGSDPSGSDASRSRGPRRRHGNAPRNRPGTRGGKTGLDPSSGSIRPAFAALVGATLFAIGAVLGPDAIGRVALLLGVLVLVLAIVAGRGARGVKECEAFRRGGMAAVDAMSGRQFRALLEHFFTAPGLPSCSAQCQRAWGRPAHLRSAGAHDRAAEALERHGPQ